jgi:CubicO group peptidase (beta-lactamase class C family)
MNFKWIVLSELIICLTLFCGCEKEIPAHDIDSAILQLMDEYDLPSVSACVIRDNAIVWEGYYGFSDREKHVVADPGTIYHIASISKLFIATAVFQLEEQGKFDLEDDISDYLPVPIRNPYFPDIPITIKMFMTHTSGLAWPQYYDEALGLWEHFEPDKAPRPTEWILEFLVPDGEHYNQNSWKKKMPGSFELYSNIGSNVLAYLVEEVSGQEFREYCMDYIFIPLDMQNTSYNYADLNSDRIALLYGDHNLVYPFFDDRLYASGGVKTSIRDLARFMMACLNNGELDGRRILQPGSIDEMLEIQNPLSGTCLIWNASIGGWYGHTGGMDGSATTADIRPESGIGMIIFTNNHNSVVYPGHEIYGLVKQKANEYIN